MSVSSIYHFVMVKASSSFLLALWNMQYIIHTPSHSNASELCSHLNMTSVYLSMLCCNFLDLDNYKVFKHNILLTSVKGGSNPLTYN